MGAPYPRFPVKSRGFRDLHAPFLNERRKRGCVQVRVQEIRGISHLLRDMGRKRWGEAPPAAFSFSHNRPVGAPPYSLGETPEPRACAREKESMSVFPVLLLCASVALAARSNN
jgi:hypothetical protein